VAIIAGFLRGFVTIPATSHLPILGRVAESFSPLMGREAKPKKNE
jgi:hypothetical protein